jgi:hypothetical protein
MMQVSADDEIDIAITSFFPSKGKMQYTIETKVPSLSYCSLDYLNWLFRCLIDVVFNTSQSTLPLLKSTQAKVVRIIDG